MWRRGAWWGKDGRGRESASPPRTVLVLACRRASEQENRARTGHTRALPLLSIRRRCFSGENQPAPRPTFWAQSWLSDAAVRRAQTDPPTSYPPAPSPNVRGFAVKKKPRGLLQLARVYLDACRRSFFSLGVSLAMRGQQTQRGPPPLVLRPRRAWQRRERFDSFL